VTAAPFPIASETRLRLVSRSTRRKAFGRSRSRRVPTYIATSRQSSPCRDVGIGPWRSCADIKLRVPEHPVRTGLTYTAGPSLNDSLLQSPYCASLPGYGEIGSAWSEVLAIPTTLVFLRSKVAGSPATSRRCVARCEVSVLFPIKSREGDLNARILHEC
jgi:hypothetical protein